MVTGTFGRRIWKNRRRALRLDGSSEGVVESAIRRDPEAIRALWREHRGWVAGVLLAHKSSEVDLEDLLQEVALTVVRRIHEVQDAGAIRGWLRTVALNAARADGRRRSRRRRLDGAYRGVHPVASGGVDDAREEAVRLLELTRLLDEKYREPLILRCVRGMSYRQIGEAMGLPETTVETRIARGRRMLRELFARQERRAQAGEDRS